MKVKDIQPVLFEDGTLKIIDQTLLPGETRWLNLETKEQVWEAISRLQVRGAPAIGVTAAYGLYIGLRGSSATTYEELKKEFEAVKAYLASSRPTAVNLFWALDRMEACFSKKADLPVSRVLEALLLEAQAIRGEDEDNCRRLGEHGLSLLKPGMGLLTHCNAGALATARYGTALSPIYLGQEQGYGFKVFAGETRPLLQGARLTCWELSRAGVDVTLICDNMAASVMKKGWIDAVLVGCDRMARNGDGANKIGTLSLAILARELGIPFYMFVPSSTIDFNAENGQEIPIELRAGEEVHRLWFERDMAPSGIKTYNPAFDVTDARYITAVVTERGIAYPPYEESLPALLGELPQGN